MHIELSPEQETLIENKVKSGQYASPSDVFTHALSLLDFVDNARPASTPEMRSAIESGWQSAQRGEFVDAEVVFARIENELADLENSSQR